MGDLTLIYYTANKISEFFSGNVTKHLSSFGPPIISVSQEPINFGENVCVGLLGVSTYNIYKQILIGAEHAKTDFVACCEDDCLYTEEHFSYRPSTFAYNMNRWNVNPKLYYYRNRIGMFTCIAPTDLLIQVLRTRFEKFPDFLPKNDSRLTGWAEPGRKEAQLGLPEVKYITFKTKIPVLTFNHRDSTGGARRLLDSDTTKTMLPHWGCAEELWRNYYGPR